MIPKQKRNSKQTNSHPQIEKLMNINFEKVINTDKTLLRFIQASAKILYKPLMETLENSICSGMFPHSFKIATVSAINKITDSKSKITY